MTPYAEQAMTWAALAQLVAILGLAVTALACGYWMGRSDERRKGK